MEETQTLVTRARKGDLDAYGLIVARFQDMAYGYACAILGDYHLAEDAAQEAFLAAYRDLPKLNDPAAFPGWFRRIVSRICARLLGGRASAAAPLEAARAVASNDMGPSQAAQRKEMRDAVLRAIRSLPDAERQVTTLFYINGYSQADIAGFLEVPVSTVKNRLHTSRKRLKERMLSMVAEELKSHALPAEFPEETQRLLERPAPGAPTESFDAVVLAAARLLGRDVDEEALHAYSINGFAPSIATWENEMAAWHMFGRASGLDLLGRRLGLRIRKLPLPPAGPAGQTPMSPEDYARAWGRIVREAMGRGEVVITEGVLEREPRWWGLITKVDEDGTVQAASIDGRLDNRVVVLGENPVWGVAKQTPSLTARQADLEMLRLAIQRIRGAGSDPADVVFGVQAMDMWIAQFAKAPFCQIECGGDGRCARCIRDSVASGAESVAKYLRTEAGEFCESAGGLVLRVAERYERIANLLKADAYGSDLGDMASRRAHAEVVDRCKQEMIAAAAKMEKILAAEGMEPEPSEHYLPQNHKALPGVALAMYEVANYEDVRKHPERTESALILTMLQASAVTGVDREPFLTAADSLLNATTTEGQVAARAVTIPLAATAWRPAQKVEARFETFRPDSAEAAFAFIKTSIDAGQAVLSETEQPLVFAGYEDAGDPAGWRLFCMTTQPRFIKQWWPWQQFQISWLRRPGRKVLACFASLAQPIAEAS